ncbi:MAG: hypothetical protein EOO59_15270 [Hymenobacter sp.]|nr:MAG: hypothetical protein EOO59_15270 [Hymenobacter sp.]
MANRKAGSITVLEHLTQARALLTPSLLGLTPKERATKPEMGEKSLEQLGCGYHLVERWRG